MIHHREFRAMGTEVELLLDRTSSFDPRAPFDAVGAEFARIERALSRFRPESELSTLNREGEIQAGTDLLAVTKLALDARERTGGLFDPTVHDALVAAGYDRSFEQVERETRAGAATGAPCGGEVVVDSVAGSIRLGRAVRLDLGGIGKGYAVDRAADLLSAYGPCVVNAGGDLAARGRAWTVGVEIGDGSLTLELADASVATSGCDRRRWRRGGVEQHHLIDPATGRPASTDLVRATVVTHSAVGGEVLAKVLFLVGEAEAVRRASASAIASVLVTVDGRTVTTGSLA